MPGLLTVLVPPASTQLTTRANAKADLALTGSADDAYIDLLNDRASAAIVAHCGRGFGALAVAESFRPRCANFAAPLILAVTPVSTISTITEDGTALAAGADFELDPAAGLVWRLSGTARCRWRADSVVVSYAAGYQLPNDSPMAGVPALPMAVQDAALALIRAAYHARGANPAIRAEQAEGAGQITYGTLGAAPMAIGPELARQLASYRAVAF